MLGTIAKTTRNLLLIAYSVATALGLVYAYQYYAVFGIIRILARLWTCEGG